MIDISSPFVETSFNVQFVTFRIDKGMEDRMLKNESRTIAVWIVFWY